MNGHKEDIIMNSLTLALITDIHYGRNDETKRGEQALELLDSTLEKIRLLKPDLLVDLGDRIVDQDIETDQKLSEAVACRFREIVTPHVHLLGNHDLENLSLPFHESVLQSVMTHSCIQLNGWHLIFWQVDARYRGGNLMIPQEDLAWLKRELTHTPYPAVLFTHVPLDSGSMQGNYYFQEHPEGRAEYYNTNIARKMVTESESVVLTVSGHAHWNQLNTIDGVHFITLQSLIETFTTHPEPAGTWATLELGSSIILDVRGKDPLKLELTPRRKGFHALTRPPRRPRPSDAPLLTAAPLPRKLKGILLDLDGVVYSGPNILPGAQAFLSHIRRLGVKLVAVTNYAGRRASTISNKLKEMGIAIGEEEILTAGWATARYLSRRHPKASVLVLGEQALEAEIEDAGLRLHDGAQEVCDYVVVGYSSEFTRKKFEEATRHLLAGAKLIGTNPDRLLPAPDGPIPGCGPQISFLEEAASTKAVIVGKPNAEIINLALSRLNVSAEDALIIGDNLETDIEAGVRAGIATVWIRGQMQTTAGMQINTQSSVSLECNDLIELNRRLFEAVPLRLPLT